MEIIKKILEPEYDRKPFFRTEECQNDFSFDCNKCGKSIRLDSKRQIDNCWNGKTDSLTTDDFDFLKTYYNTGLNNKSLDGGFPVFDKLTCSKCDSKYVSYCAVREFSNSAFTITLNGLFKIKSANKTENIMTDAIEVSQKQDRELLTEHAKSSYGLTWIGKYEWLMAVLFIIIGVLILLFTESIKASGYVFLVIGVLELIKYPKRINRWVDKKAKEKIFEKEIKFCIQDTSLKISIDNTDKEVSFSQMRNCMISNTGLLFKVSYTEYYYISFTSITSKSPNEITEFLMARFDKKRITNKS